MRWLVLPDIHDKIRRANAIIAYEPHDRLLLLGDFFDDFSTGVTDAADTARQLKQWLHDPNTVCLLGNHDMAYGWGNENRRLLCPGFDRTKWITIHSILTAKDWLRFRLHVWMEDRRGSWLVTHAGFHPSWLDGTEPDGYRARIDHLSAQAWDALLRGEHHPLLGRGVSRGGGQAVGGLNWMDWSEFIPIPGVSQLVGHSAGNAVRRRNVPHSRNLCIDTHLRHYAIFENGHLEIRT